jgi:hypothetical protein
MKNYREACRQFSAHAVLNCTLLYLYQVFRLSITDFQGQNHAVVREEHPLESDYAD